MSNRIRPLPEDRATRVNPSIWCAIVAALAVAVGFPTEAAERPNIVLIMADDMGFECVTANGGESYQTPHLDRLAARGMRFENCYSQPLCTPSRVQIMTGRYNSRNYLRFGILDPRATIAAAITKGKAASAYLSIELRLSAAISRSAEGTA